MSIIPNDFLPPADFLPDKIYLLPELQLPLKVNIVDYCLDRHIRAGLGDKVLIYYKDQTITYSDMQKRVNRLANALKGLGIEKNDRVMLRSPNNPEIFSAYFACWRIGAIPVLTQHLLRAEEITYRANDSEAKAMIVSSDTFADVADCLDQMKTVKEIIVFGKRIQGFHFYDDLVGNQPDHIPTEEIGRDDYFRIIYSSGTTGKPKGILNTVGDTIATMESHCRHILHLTPDDVIGGHPAFAFAFGFCLIVFSGFNGGSTSLVDRFDPEQMFQTVEKHKISVLFCVPTAFRMMLGIKDAEKKYDLSSLRLCQSAGEALPGDIAKEWRRRFGMLILDSVGSGEINYWLSTTETTPDDKLDSSGKPLPGVEVRLVDSSFKDVSKGAEGEMLIRAPWGNQYWRRPDKQKKEIVNGWSRTGLIFKEDEDGYYWFHGRDDEMIVSAGYKIPAGEVEAAICQHPSVMETAVVGAPDTLRGSIVKAFIVLKPGYDGSATLAEEIKTFVKEKIEMYKYPREVEFITEQEMPRTITGKIRRFALRDREKEKS